MRRRAFHFGQVQHSTPLGVAQGRAARREHDTPLNEPWSIRRARGTLHNRRYGMASIQGQLTAFGDKYGKLGFAVSCLNTVLLLAILFL
jgi:hypothetical protein